MKVKDTYCLYRMVKYSRIPLIILKIYGGYSMKEATSLYRQFMTPSVAEEPTNQSMDIQLVHDALLSIAPTRDKVRELGAGLAGRTCHVKLPRGQASLLAALGGNTLVCLQVSLQDEVWGFSSPGLA